jgi:serine/threonine protein kinase
VTLKPGSTFASYRIDDALGEGGMATVYKAWEAGLARHVALKVMPSELAKDKTFGERFDREAKVVAKLEHPNIIPIFAYGIQAGMPWMAMRMVSGGNLSSLGRGRPVPPKRTLDIVEAVADALDYAHEKGVIHRDVKPQNILLDESGRVYLVDFGIARLTEGAQRLTQAGLVAGTPHYMAPEQALGGELDSKVDIYALGVVTYELLTGVTPFQAEVPMDVLMKHISDPVPVPPRGSIPDGLIEPLLKCLAKKPEDRWPTAKAFAEALVRGLYESDVVEPGLSTGDFEPTVAMERPDFDALYGPKGPPTFEPTVLSRRPTFPESPSKEFAPRKQSSSPADADPEITPPRSYEPTVLSQRAAGKATTEPPKSPGYEPTVFSPRATGKPGTQPPEGPRYEPTVFAQRPSLPGAPKAMPVADSVKPPADGDQSGLKVAVFVLVGLGLLVLAGVGGYAWWSGRKTEVAGSGVAPEVTVATGAPAKLPEPPETPAPQEPAQPAADATAAPDAVEPAVAPTPVTPPQPKPQTAPPARAPARNAPAPRGTVAPSVKVAEPAPGAARPASPDATARPEPAAAVGKQAGGEETGPLEAVPEASRSWTNVREFDRTVGLQLERSVDLGVRVDGVAVDRVFITSKDARSGIKKLFKKSTDKLRFTAEFLLNCPRDGSRPKLIFEVELQKQEGGVLERLSEKKSCEGHVKLSRDVAMSILEEGRKVRIRVRSAS